MTSIIERRRPRVEPFLLPFDTIFIYFLLQLLLLLFDLFHFVFLALVVDFGLEAVDLDGLAVLAQSDDGLVLVEEQRRAIDRMMVLGAWDVIGRHVCLEHFESVWRPLAPLEKLVQSLLRFLC